MASNRKAFAELDRHIRRLRGMKDFTKDTAPKVAKALKVEIDAQIARGEDPSGKAWKLTQDGRVPLRRAARAVTVKAIKNIILVRVIGHHARHDLGAVSGKIRRKIIPSQRDLGPVIKAVKEVLPKEFEARMGSTT